MNRSAKIYRCLCDIFDHPKDPVKMYSNEKGDYLIRYLMPHIATPFIEYRHKIKHYVLEQMDLAGE